jgi:hypothetical protein
MRSEACVALLSKYVLRERLSSFIPSQRTGPKSSSLNAWTPRVSRGVLS